MFLQREGMPAIVENAGSRPIPGAAIHRTKSTLLDLFPEAWCVHWGFESIVIPPASAEVPPGQAAVYGIMDLNPQDYFGKEGAIAGAWWDLLPCDHDATYGVAWGNKFGTGAAFIIDDQINAVQGQWGAMGVACPAVTGFELQQNVSYTLTKTFPPGAQSEETPVKFEAAQTMLGGVKRVPAGQRVRLAFALNRTDFNNARVEGGTLSVRAQGYVVFWPTSFSSAFVSL